MLTLIKFCQKNRAVGEGYQGGEGCELTFCGQDGHSSLRNIKEMGVWGNKTGREFGGVAPKKFLETMPFCLAINVTM